MKLTHNDVQDILDILNGSTFDELNLQTGRLRLFLRRSGEGEWVQSIEDRSMPNIVKLDAAPKIPAASSAASKTEEAPSSDGLLEIRAPLVGTFYRAPKPGASPFVEVGSSVEKETVVGIVETMKLMNSVFAGAQGKVVEICLDDADFVEHNAVLMRIQPEGI